MSAIHPLQTPRLALANDRNAGQILSSVASPGSNGVAPKAARPCLDMDVAALFWPGPLHYEARLPAPFLKVENADRHSLPTMWEESGVPARLGGPTTAGLLNSACLVERAADDLTGQGAGQLAVLQ
jgi:hypothetical protein